MGCSCYSVNSLLWCCYKNSILSHSLRGCAPAKETLVCHTHLSREGAWRVLLVPVGPESGGTRREHGCTDTQTHSVARAGKPRWVGERPAAWRAHYPRPHAQEKSSGGHFSRIPQSWSLGHPRASAVIDHLGAPHTSWTHVASGVPQAWPWCQGGPCPALWSATVAMDARGYQPERGLRAEGLCRF